MSKVAGEMNKYLGKKQTRHNIKVGSLRPYLCVTVVPPVVQTHLNDFTLVLVVRVSQKVAALIQSTDTSASHDTASCLVIRSIRSENTNHNVDPQQYIRKGSSIYHRVQIYTTDQLKLNRIEPGQTGTLEKHLALPHS
ncbi:hypothetical protein LOAG_05195 [Loa loa]|uniref:Uncharacterized protein n=1 Tax=Loa loa TaxID=7209 RepID=A0A1S0U0I3_LOALO|nr:hypothetical protein LOAG_05195 [Loa loa]EFO23288.1 hypothetical protein LOAG_05195 [Loa loa]